MFLEVSTIIEHLSDEGYEVTCFGDNKRSINGYCSLYDLRDNSITWAKKYEYIDTSSLNDYKNVIVIVNSEPIGRPIDEFTYIVCNNPKSAFFELLLTFFSPTGAPSISETTCVEATVIGDSFSVGHHSYICADVIIGKNVRIANNVTIECPTVIGDNTSIGSGTVIGSSGYGYFETPSGIQKMVPHFGGVRIGSNVEIGANVCIDRGTLGDTIIGDNVKIDNLCHIAHNVLIEDNCFVIALSMLGGSAHLCEGAYIAPGVLVMNQATVGRRSLVGLGAVVTKDVEAGKVVVGVPAKPIRDNI